MFLQFNARVGALYEMPQVESKIIFIAHTHKTCNFPLLTPCTPRQSTRLDEICSKMVSTAIDFLAPCAIDFLAPSESKMAKEEFNPYLLNARSLTDPPARTLCLTVLPLAFRSIIPHCTPLSFFLFSFHSVPLFLSPLAFTSARFANNVTFHSITSCSPTYLYITLHIPFCHRLSDPLLA